MGRNTFISVRLIGRNFVNKKTEKTEIHYFENAYTLRLWVVSMCMPWGDYLYKKPEIDII